MMRVTLGQTSNLYNDSSGVFCSARIAPEVWDPIRCIPGYSTQAVNPLAGPQPMHQAGLGQSSDIVGSGVRGFFWTIGALGAIALVGPWTSKRLAR